MFLLTPDGIYKWFLVSMFEPHIGLIVTVKIKRQRLTADVSINIYGEQFLYSSQVCRLDSCLGLSTVISVSDSVFLSGR